jgi:hypothetical protein
MFSKVMLIPGGNSSDFSQYDQSLVTLEYRLSFYTPLVSNQSRLGMRLMLDAQLGSELQSY